MDGWKTTFLLGRSIFRGYVSFREGTPGEEKKPMSDSSILPDSESNPIESRKLHKKFNLADSGRTYISWCMLRYKIFKYSIERERERDIN